MNKAHEPAVAILEGKINVHKEKITELLDVIHSIEPSPRKDKLIRSVKRSHKIINSLISSQDLLLRSEGK